MELCIDFGGTEIKLAVIEGADILASDRIAVAGTAADLDAAVTASRSLIERTGAPTAIGIAVPGVVDPETGRMLHANDKYESLNGFDLKTWSAENFGLPAVIENDARAALIGETSTGSASGERNAVLVTLGTGIGTAAMIDGTALRGVTGHAGILGGHITTDLHGPVCPCGNVGCGEALASSWALREEMPPSTGSGTDSTGSGTDSTGSGTGPTGSGTGPTGSGTGSTGSGTGPTGSGADKSLTVKDLFESAAHAGIRDEFLRVWGATVVTLCHMYDPRVVILSGGILRAGDAVREPIESYVRTHLWPSLTPPRFIVPPEPEYSVARGLSSLARNQTHQEST